MADKSQKLQTDLIFKAHDAITQINELAAALDKVSNIKFNNVTSLMGSMRNAILKIAESSNDSTKAQKNNAEVVKTLIQQQTKLIREMQQEYAKVGKGVVDTSSWKQNIGVLNDLTQQIARMKAEMGDLGSVRKEFERALSLSMGNDSLVNNLKQQLNSFEKKYAEVKALMTEARVKNDNSANRRAQAASEKAEKERLRNIERARRQQEQSDLRAQREQERVAKKEEAYANRLASLKARIEEIQKRVNQHKGDGGLVYTQAAFNAEIARINKIKQALLSMGHKNLASAIVPENMLAGVNKWQSDKPPLGAYQRFRQELNKARESAENMFHSFKRTNSEADKIRFEKARTELMRLNHQAEEFNKQISKAARTELTLGNIIKRAKEAANWKIGNAIENAIVDTPFEAFHDIKEYELAMAGVTQVLPKLELGQQHVNEEFQAFTEIAGRYGQSIRDVMEAGKSIGRMYGHDNDERGEYTLGVENTNLLTMQAAKMATVDNFDVLEATRGLESALAQFNMQTDDSNLLMARSAHILDIWTALAHQSGASAQDLTEGVRQAGASAHSAGVSFEFLNALIATGVRSTAKTGNEIGTTLKSMFSSMQSDKAIRAMQDFGIEVYRVGETGKTEMRPLQDLIMDISLALQTTTKDTKGVTDFLLAISGGKFQISKVDAILKNYGEIQRALGVARNSAGFTNKQLEYQMDTMYRKIETLKANIASIFQQAGSDGLVNDMKWILNILIRVTKGMSTTESHAYKWAKGITTVVAAYKLLPPLLNVIARASGRAAGAWVATRASGVGIAGVIPSVGSSTITDAKANYLSRRGSQFNRTDSRLSRTSGSTGATAATNANTSATTANATAHANAARSVTAETSALTRQSGALATNTAAHGSNTSALVRQRGATSSAAAAQNTMRAGLTRTNMVLAQNGVMLRQGGANLKRYSNLSQTAAANTRRMNLETARVVPAVQKIAPAARAASGAMNGIASATMGLTAAFGGLQGMLIALAAMSAIYLVVKADGLGEAAEKAEKLRQETEDAIVTAQELEEQSRRNGEEAERLANKYNELADELEGLESAADNSSDSLERQNEIKKNMGLISERLAVILHENSDQFMEDGKMNLDMIEKLAQADKDKALATITNKESEVDADIAATDTAIRNTQDRIDALRTEAYSAGKLALVYRGLYAVIAGVHSIMSYAAQTGESILSDDIGEQFRAAGNIPIMGAASLPGVEVVKAVMGKEWVANEKAWLGKSKEWADSQAWENISKATDPNLNPEALWDMEKIQKVLPDLQSRQSDLQAQKDKIREASNRIKLPEDIDTTNENRNYDRDATMPDEKDGKGRDKKGREGKEDKESWSFDSEFDKGIAAILEGENSPLKGKASITALMSLAAAINGTDVHGMKSDSFDNPLGVTPEMWEKYASEYTRNAHNSFGVFADEWNEILDSGVSSFEDAVRKYLLRIGKSEEEASSIVTQIAENSAYMDEHYDFKNAAGAVPKRNEKGTGFSDGTNALSLLDTSIYNNLGQTMRNHAVGCVEAVDQILAGVEDYFKGLYDEEVFRVPNLIERMISDGYSVVPFDASQLEKGDIISFNDLGVSRDANPASDSDGQNVHVMLYSGDGNIVGNSTDADKIVTRTLAEHETYQTPAWIIKTNIANGGMGVSSDSQYKDDLLSKYYGSNNGSVYSMGYDYAKEFQKFMEMSEEKYKMASTSIENSKRFYGDNFSDSQKEYVAELERLADLSKQKRVVDQAYIRAQTKVNDFLAQHPEIERALKNDKMSWDDLTLEEQKERFEKVGGKDSGKIIDQADALRKSRNSINEQHEEQFYRFNSVRGYLNPREAYEYRRDILSSTIDNDGAERDWFNQTERAKQEKDLAEAELARLKERLAQEKENNDRQVEEAKERIEKDKKYIAVLKEKKDLTSEEREELDRLTKSIEINTSIVQNGTEAYRNAEKAVISQSEAVKEATENYHKLADELHRVESDMTTDFFDKLIVQGNSLRDILGDIVKQIASITIRRSFDNIFGVKHESMGSIDDILGGKYSRKKPLAQYLEATTIPSSPFYRSRLFPTIQNGSGIGYEGGVGNAVQGLTTAMTAQTAATAANTATTATGTTVQTLGNTATQLATVTQQASTATDAAVTTANTMALGTLTAQMAVTSASSGFGLSSIFGIFAKGGYIPSGVPGFASGGFSGSGLIRGAGTGTSDSILTYLAHRRQFIRTSDGEYIIKKDSVDKLGIPFLDMLNSQPELAPAMDGFKRYMDGGSLGTSMSPTMKASTAESYRRFNRANGAIKMASNEKMENLLAGLREDVRAGNKQETPVQPVILNTQASSAEVMKAIAKNPRAFNKIMGGHQKHGFR
jgi:TP901 family phage tail tape measure protein